MAKHLHDDFNGIPLRHNSPVSMEIPNEPITIYAGEFNLKGQNKEYRMTGELSFKWVPNKKVKLTGSFLDSFNPSVKLMEKFDLLIEGKVHGAIEITGISIGDKTTCIGEASRFVWGEKAIPVKEVSFAMLNMKEFLGDTVKDVTATGVMRSNARLVFDDKPFKIELDTVHNYKELTEKLNDKGGYLITHAGKVSKNKGDITLIELQDWHDRFHHFLYFLNGRRVAPMFYTGLHEGEQIWTDYSAYTIDMHKNVLCWSDTIFLNDLPQLWKSYNKIWKKDVADRDFLTTAIHWYVEANSNAGKVEGSIILIQTALELIYNWFLVERQKMVLGGDAEGLSAANKIRLLIYQFKISADIPIAFKGLAAIPNVQDGPEAFVKIRNALVHGQGTKRAELRKITLEAKYQALQLGIWYVELALLYIMGYKGKYNNRTDGNIWRDTGVLVPWEQDQSFKIGKPSDFTDDELETFVELLEKQNKVNDPSITKVKRCKTIAIGFSWGQPVAIGGIKPKTSSDFKFDKANLPDLEKNYDWEIGYFFTEKDFEGRGFSSTILTRLLDDYGKGSLMATTEIREGNRMINILQRRGFKQVGETWASSKSGNDLRLFVRD